MSQGLRENGVMAACLNDSHADPTSPLDRRSSMPLFVQLTTELREQLNSGMSTGRLKAGDFFTTERFLCRKYRVSTITAKRALDELESDGLVVRHRGRGTFVARSLVIQNLDHFYRFTTAMQAQGFQPTWKNLRIDTAKPEAGVRKLLGLSEDEKVIRIERLRLLNGEPYFLHTSHLPTSLFPDLEHQDHEGVALYDLLAQNYHVAPARCQDTFEPVLLKKRAASLLQVPARSAGMLLRRVTFTAEGVPIELSRGVIRGDRCRLTVDLW
ncbi:MAG TPA: GntR family transcriptional regulator [Terriglobia bacterium]|nr:GntR family transcriptional regulator [Terriglobia bacterium]